MRRLLVLFASVLLVAGAPLERVSPWAAVARPLFVHVDTRALPHPDVRRLAIDRLGFLWVGTPGGLARFDGYSFRAFVPDAQNPSALPDGFIRALEPDPNGGLWIGTNSSGLVKFDERTETFHTWRPSRHAKNGLRSTVVWALATSPDGRLWVGGDGGLDLFDPRAGTFEHVSLGARALRSPAVLTLYYDREHVLWAGTTMGLYRATGRSGFRRLPLELTRGDNRVWHIYEDSAGRLWVSGSGGQVYLEKSRRQFVRPFTSREDLSSVSFEHTTVIEPTPGTLWIGTGTGSISEIDTATWHVRKIEPDPESRGGLARGTVQQFLRDPSGLIWIAKGTGGLELYNPASRGLYELSATRRTLGLAETGPTAVGALSADRFWAGGIVGVLTRFDARGPLVSVKIGLHTVLSFARTGNGGMLVGVGLLCLIPDGSVTLQCPVGPREIGLQRMDALLDDGRSLWVGTQSGLYEENLATKALRVYRGGRARNALTNPWVTALLRDRDGNMWVGTQAGLNRIDRSGHVERFRFEPGSPNSLSPGGVDALLQDRRGRIWAGTIGGQLNVLERMPQGGLRIRHLGRADGLPHENVDGLAEDARGRIWASTPRGLAVFEPDSFQARSFGIIDGVSDGPYHAGSISQAGDTIFFGGFEGVTIVAPGAASPWSYSPPLVVTGLTVGTRSVPAWEANEHQTPLRLPANEHDVTVEFSALDYSDPAALRYRYRLDGYETAWHEADAEHRFATYTNLPPGNYTLRVRATNRLGAWSDRALAIRMEAIPAWYETWWFRALLIALLISLAYLAHRLRTAVLRRRQRELEGIVEERTTELSAANADLKRAYAVLEEMSLTDPLTGLRNRRFLTQNIGDEVALALRRYADWAKSDDGALPGGADLIFFLADIDHFKAVNDEYGHAAGDRVLSEMRLRLEEVFRETDYLIRWGGEEFLAVARRSRRSDAADLAERLRIAVASRPFELDGGKQISKTASIGFAALPFVPDDPDAIGWLSVVELADEALYAAKRDGRNRWYGAVMNEKTKAAIEGSPRITAEELVRAGAVDIVTGQRFTSALATERSDT